MPKATFDCPRRGDMLLWGASSAKWADYIELALDPEGHPVLTDDGQVIPPQDHWRKDGTCSYCGGMSPDGLFEAIEAGAEIGPTDKNYKVYVDGAGRGKFYLHHLNRENAARLRELIAGGKVTIGYPGHFYNGIWLARPTDPQPS